MKKLLLILICLFVSFEVKSKEIILVCKVSEEKLFRDKNFKEYRVREHNIFKDFKTKTELFYLDMKRKWIGEIKYPFENKDLVIRDEDKNLINLKTKDINFEYLYFWTKTDMEVGSTLTSTKLETNVRKIDLSNQLNIDLNTYDGTITYEKYYVKPQVSPIIRYDHDIVPEGNVERYNIILKKGVCEKKKKKLF